MSRPNKSGLDYFPLDVHLDEKIELIEAKHGLAGFGLIIKLLQKIYQNGYFFEATEDRLLLLKKRLDVDYNFIVEVIKDACRWQLFYDDHYEKYNVLTSPGIQKRYFEATKRRKELEFIKEYLCFSDPKTFYKDTVNVNINSINVNKNKINDRINSQSKVKESKGKNNTPLNPPKGEEKETLFSELKNYLINNLPQKLKPYEISLFDFYKYRMQMVKKRRYRTSAGIDGLFRDLIECLESGLNPTTCCQLAQENDWLTPRVKYIESAGLVMAAKNTQVNGSSEKTQAEIEQELDEAMA